MLVASILGCLAIFGPSLRAEFVLDDISNIQQNDLLRHITNLPRLFLLPYSGVQETGAYRPLTMATFAFNDLLLGPKPWGFHLVNLLLHAINVWLIFLFLEGLTRDRRLASWTALWFLVLPIHTEAVTGIVNRSELLAFGCSLLTLRAVIATPLRAGVFFLLALLSKESAVGVLPLALILIVVQARVIAKPILQHVWAHRGSLVVLCGALLLYLGVRLLVLGPHMFGTNATVVENPLVFVSSPQRVLTALKILTLYLAKSVWPVTLSSDYSYNQIPVVHTLTEPWAWLGLLLLGILIWVGVFMPFVPSAKRPASTWVPWAMASAFFLWPFLPVANLIFPIGTIMAERLMYAPSLGLCLLLALVAERLSRRPVFGPTGDIGKPAVTSALTRVVMVSLLIFYACRSHLRTWDWQTEKTLFLSAAAASPHSVLSRSNKGAVYLREGRYEEAEKEIIAAHRIYLFYPPAMNNLGLIYRHQGRLDLAEQQFLKTIRTASGYPNAYDNLALVYIDQGRHQEAEAVLQALENAR